MFLIAIFFISLANSGWIHYFFLLSGCWSKYSLRIWRYSLDFFRHIQILFLVALTGLFLVPKKMLPLFWVAFLRKQSFSSWLQFKPLWRGRKCPVCLFFSIIKHLTFLLFAAPSILPHMMLTAQAILSTVLLSVLRILLASTVLICACQASGNILTIIFITGPIFGLRTSGVNEREN